MGPGFPHLRLTDRLRIAVLALVICVPVPGTLGAGVAKDCPLPIPDAGSFKGNAELSALYNRAFFEGYQQAIEEKYRSQMKGAPEGGPERRAWITGWLDGRWHGLARSVGGGCVTRISPPSFSTERERLDFFRDRMRTAILDPNWEWLQMTLRRSVPYCQRLLADLLNERHVKAIEPLIRFEEPDHHSLAPYRACAQTGTPAPPDQKRTFRLGDIGALAFRYYGNLPIVGSRNYGDVIYSEILPTEQHRYAIGGYRALDASSCGMAMLASVRPTTFRVDPVDPSFLDNLLVEWQGLVIVLELNGLPPFYLDADRLRVSEGDRSLDCRWMGASKAAAAHLVNRKQGTLIPKTIMKSGKK